jgi:8-oxo-dGTP diphosphatase
MRGDTLKVVAAAIMRDGKVLLVSKRSAPEVFYLPGGKPDPGETPLETLARELKEELGVSLVESSLLTIVHDQAALERTPMEMHVYLSTVSGVPAPQAELAALAWTDAAGDAPGELAPAIRNHVLPHLAERGLLS